MAGKNVVSLEQAELKLKAALAARKSPDFFIIARTDARAVHGLDDALNRARRFLEIGVDSVFVEAPQSVEELKIIGRSFDAPILVNMAEGLKDQLADVKVNLDSKGDAMKAEECTDPVLYAGWEPGLAGKALPWQPGAVGFCIAVTDSFSFKKKSQKLDAIEIIRRGACHSLGGIGPAFLSAYPVPHHFFPLILGGNHDIGEVIRQTAPHSSWTITYLGDPMYCPFRANSQLDIDQVEKWLRKPLEHN